ncbi:MAG: glycosyltransferase family 4 protein [Actinobacteria bacterium]|nr:glycosyltransferase family 4 protein [Actinomycetota bacterium]
MRVGFDARVIGWPGLGTYSRSLLNNFSGSRDINMVCFYNDETRDMIPKAANITLAPLNQDIFSKRNLKKVGEVVNEAGCEIFHTPHVVAPEGLECPLLVTAHDLIPLLFPKTVPLRYRRTSRILLDNAIRRADHLITASSASRDYIKQYYGLADGGISLIPDGVDGGFYYRRGREEIDAVLNKYRISSPHILWLGSCMPHKNVEALVEAFAMLPAEFSDYQLTLAGKQAGRHWQKIDGKITDAGLADRVNLPGFIDDADLPALFSSAGLFCFPSLYEGFGLPPLEAMACGTPVLSSNLTSLPEVVGDAGILTDPTAESIRAGIIRILSDAELRQDLAKKGLERSRAYTWEKTAALTLEVYEELLRSGG